MKPTVHVSFPRPLYARFRSLASALGWGVRGQCWLFLDLLLAHAEERPELFRNRMAKTSTPNVDPFYSPNPRPHERPV